MSSVEAENAVIRERGRIKAAVTALGDAGKFFESNGKIDVLISRNDVYAIINGAGMFATASFTKVDLEEIKHTPDLVGDYANKATQRRNEHIDQTAWRVWDVPQFIRKYPRLLKLWARVNSLTIEIQREQMQAVTIYRFKKRGVVVGMTRIKDY